MVQMWSNKQDIAAIILLSILGFIGIILIIAGLSKESQVRDDYEFFGVFAAYNLAPVVLTILLGALTLILMLCFISKAIRLQRVIYYLFSFFSVISMVVAGYTMMLSGVAVRECSKAQTEGYISYWPEYVQDFCDSEILIFSGAIIFAVAILFGELVVMAISVYDVVDIIPGEPIPNPRQHIHVELPNSTYKWVIISALILGIGGIIIFGAGLIDFNVTLEKMNYDLSYRRNGATIAPFALLFFAVASLITVGLALSRRIRDNPWIYLLYSIFASVSMVLVGVSLFIAVSFDVSNELITKRAIYPPEQNCRDTYEYVKNAKAAQNGTLTEAQELHHRLCLGDQVMYAGLIFYILAQILANFAMIHLHTLDKERELEVKDQGRPTKLTSSGNVRSRSGRGPRMDSSGGRPNYVYKKRSTSYRSRNY